MTDVVTLEGLTKAIVFPIIVIFVGLYFYLLLYMFNRITQEE